MSAFTTIIIIIIIYLERAVHRLFISARAHTHTHTHSHKIARVYTEHTLFLPSSEPVILKHGVRTHFYRTHTHYTRTYHRYRPTGRIDLEYTMHYYTYGRCWLNTEPSLKKWTRKKREKISSLWSSASFLFIIIIKVCHSSSHYLHSGKKNSYSPPQLYIVKGCAQSVTRAIQCDRILCRK